MSVLTPCNYCTYKRMKRRAKAEGQKIEVRPEHNGWRVVIDGKPAGVWFMSLTSYCVC